MKQDILDRSDIEFLVNLFYQKVKSDEILAHFFNDLDWEHHLPKMYDFWSAIIFNTAEYKGNPVSKHIALNRRLKLENFHFDHWLVLWKTTVEENFTGVNALSAIQRAQSIKAIIQHKLNVMDTNINFGPSV